MKLMLLAIFLPLSFARAEGEAVDASKIKAEKSSLNIESVKPLQLEEASTGLFERVRSAHVRAVQQGRLGVSSERKT